MGFNWVRAGWLASHFPSQEQMNWRLAAALFFFTVLVASVLWYATVRTPAVRTYPDAVAVADAGSVAGGEADATLALDPLTPPPRAATPVIGYPYLNVPFGGMWRQVYPVDASGNLIYPF